MTDYELLELAAKAAGYWEINGWSVETHKGMRWVNQDCYFERYWNPLTDDGDALRLAAKLNMELKICNGVTIVGDGHSDLEYTETNRIEYLAATRRAIVRAAAELGRK
jgi:hypothetical protein